ncbi:carboxypeptidase regulatory-like domain-containing protein [Candidatus Margulisiibacteriota bacterium]
MPSGSYYVKATDYRGYTAQKTGIVVINQNVDIGILVLSLTGSISGKATLEEETDYTGISIILSGTNFAATTDAAGDFAMEEVTASDNYTVVYSKSGFSSESVTAAVQEKTETELPDKRLDLVPTSATISGTVTLEGETSHSGTTISVAGTSLSTTSAADGSYSIENVPEGDRTVEFSKTTYFDESVTTTVIADEDQTLSSRELETNPHELSLAGDTVNSTDSFHTLMNITIAEHKDRVASIIVRKYDSGSATTGTEVAEMTYNSGTNTLSVPSHFMDLNGKYIRVVTKGTNSVTGEVSDAIQITNDYVYKRQWGSSGTGNAEFENTYGVGADSAGDIYISDANNNRVQKFRADGTFVAKWGKNDGNGDSGDGDGEFNYPEGIAVDSEDNIYVIDNSNDRVQVFSGSTKFVVVE